MALLADHAQMNEDVVEAAGQGDLHGMERHARTGGRPVEASQQIAAESSQHVLDGARL